MKDLLITDFSNSLFQVAFQCYFKELGINVSDWDGLFKEMNDEQGNKAFLRLSDDNNVIGFILFTQIRLSSWFFEEDLGFIREFWIAEEYRNAGHGSELLQKAEVFFVQNGVHKSILTTDTAERFYKARGYKNDKSYVAKNKDDVLVKEL